MLINAKIKKSNEKEIQLINSWNKKLAREIIVSNNKIKININKINAKIDYLKSKKSSYVEPNQDG
jgi:hypothetical protein